MRRGTGIFLFIALSLAAACNIWDGPQDTDELPPSAAPTGLKLIQVSGKPALSWDNVAGATRYSIYRSENDGPYTRVASFTPPPASWTIPDTGGDRDYRYRVSVTTASSSESSLSQAVSLKTWQPVARILIESSVAYITWNSVANAMDYRVYHYNGSDPDNGTFVLQSGTISSDPSGTVFRYDTQATLSSADYYKVVTINFDGKEGISSVYLCTVPRNGKVLSTQEDSLTLSWDMVPGAKAYNLYWSTTSGVYPPLQITKDILTNVYTHTDTDPNPAVDMPLTPGTEYFYEVSAVFDDGGVDYDESPARSPEFSGFTLPGPPAVSAVF
ncbi:MAG: fibronectin type III domain-containing protein, partial [Spirochaetales bacterium]|nr:fibronectin type III domain-containing protein [Spirochaetales bacterium]